MVDQPSRGSPRAFQGVAGRGGGGLGVDLHRYGEAGVPEDLHGDSRVDVELRADGAGPFGLPLVGVDVGE